MECEDRPSAGYIYDAMEKAKKSIIEAFSHKESDYKFYVEVIDQIWMEEFHSPLYAAAYHLNPSLFYNLNFSSNKVIQKGLLDCIQTLEPDLSTQVAITEHIMFYNEAGGDFGRPVAVRGRESLAPATWWSVCAVDYPGLQRLAIRILSQTCCITRCQRNLNIFELQSKNGNGLDHQKFSDLVFVHHNLHLQRKQAEATKGVRRPTCSEATDINVDDWMNDAVGTESDDLSWMDVKVPSDRTLINHEVRRTTDSNESSDDSSGTDKCKHRENDL